MHRPAPWDPPQAQADPPRSAVEVAVRRLHRLLLAQGGSTGGGQGGEAGGTSGAEGRSGGPEAMHGPQSQSAELAHARREVARRASAATHAEWWAHTRAPAAAHQLHFDTNESNLRQVGAFGSHGCF
jgi:hypothetical protein